MNKNNMQIVIPCGGLATRLGELAKDIPKSMIDINGRSFLELQIELIKKYDFTELILCIGHLGEQIKKHFGNGEDYDISIKYSKDNNLGVIGAVKNAEPFLEDSFFMMYGDSYLPALNFNDMYVKFMNQEKLAMMSVWQNKNYVDKSNITIKNGEITNIGNPDADYIDYGAIIMKKDALKLVPSNQPFSTKAFWQKLLDINQLSIYEVTERLYHIGSKEALKELRDVIAHNKG